MKPFSFLGSILSSINIVQYLDPSFSPRASNTSLLIPKFRYSNSFISWSIPATRDKTVVSHTQQLF